MNDFIVSNELIMCDSNLPRETFTFLSSAFNTTKWLDHVLSSKTIKVSAVTVRYDLAFYDHLPIQFEVHDIAVGNGLLEYGSHPHGNFPVVNWSELKKPHRRKEYNQRITNSLNDLPICVNSECRLDHKQQIQHYYDSLVAAIGSAAKQFTTTNKSRFKPVPGWNKLCKVKYKHARTSFLQWVASGKIRSGSLYEEMKISRNSFKSALKYCKLKEKQLRNEGLASALNSDNQKSF